ncbi:MAG: hypothetical protein B7Y36_07490 [Novosphingobium sp. 28-62-57]|uniref:hypothetical protein n=1 Tax=unclassified Novosphingobium TaxID=2644732 RepID=UPI000BD40371|nr:MULTISPECIES: hypothetical protein [unclassified Novosphingobium]OYW50993.1 MAG: hypothetical protein B7Z34_01530 [Novosphingobium sp. 12-62-10]OYZ11185.1 MAG: hypothetical protein B7Y36_07490 [Novosphingobium sp. 28-62-57]OZA36242.1 MAG: hypothetical protein B7X92_07075 [Novosphingobium sp. 17-62-9]
MTNIQRTESGLRFIALPNTTLIERIAFSVIRRWRWTGILAAIALTAGSLTCSVILARWLFAEDPVRSGYIGLLFTIPLIIFLLWQAATIELRTAPIWMIRAALAAATDDERAFLFESLLQLAMSEWRQDPITCAALFDLFRQARLSFGDRISSKRKRLMAVRDRQVVVLRNLARIGEFDTR